MERELKSEVQFDAYFCSVWGRERSIVYDVAYLLSDHPFHKFATSWHTHVDGIIFYTIGRTLFSIDTGVVPWELRHGT